MFGNAVFDTQCRAFRANMWTVLTLVFCAVYPALTIALQQETGPVHIHKKPNSLHWSGLLMEFLQEPEDVEATKIAENFIKNLLPTLDTRIEKSVEKYIVLQELSAGFTLALNDFIWVGFQNATLDNLTVRVMSPRVKFNASIPYLSAGGTFSVNGYIEDNNIAIIGNLSTLLKDIKVTGAMDFQVRQLPSRLDVLQITDSDIKIDLSNIVIELELVDQPVAMKMALKKLMNKPVDKIVESVYRAAKKMVNEKLAKISAFSIINFLLPEKEKPATDPATAVPSVQRRSPYLRASNYPNYRYGYN